MKSKTFVWLISLLVFFWLGGCAFYAGDNGPAGPDYGYPGYPDYYPYDTPYPNGYFGYGYGGRGDGHHEERHGERFEHRGGGPERHEGFEHHEGGHDGRPEEHNPGHGGEGHHG